VGRSGQLFRFSGSSRLATGVWIGAYWSLKASSTFTTGLMGLKAHPNYLPCHFLPENMDWHYKNAGGFDEHFTFVLHLILCVCVCVWVTK